MNASTNNGVPYGAPVSAQVPANGPERKDSRCVAGGVFGIATFAIALISFVMTVAPFASYASSFDVSYLLGAAFGGILLRWLPLLLLGIGGVLCKRGLIKGSNIFLLVLMAIATVGMLIQVSRMASMTNLLSFVSGLFALAGTIILLVFMSRSSATPLGAGIKALPGICMIVSAVIYLAYTIFLYSIAGYAAEMIFSSGIAATLIFMLTPFVLSAISYLLIGMSSVIDKPSGAVQTAPMPGAWPQGQTAAQPQPQVQARPAVQPQPRVQPAVQPQPQVQPAVRPQPQPQVQRAVQPQTQPISQVHPVSQPAADTAAGGHKILGTPEAKASAANGRQGTPAPAPSSHAAQQTGGNYCQGCGRLLDPREKFCYKCGTPAS